MDTLWIYTRYLFVLLLMQKLIPNRYINQGIFLLNYNIQMINSTIIMSCNTILTITLLNNPINEPQPASNACFSFVPTINSPITAPRNGPSTSPKAGITNGPTIMPIVDPMTDAFVPPYFFTPHAPTI